MHEGKLTTIYIVYYQNPVPWKSDRSTALYRNHQSSQPFKIMYRPRLFLVGLIAATLTIAQTGPQAEKLPACIVCQTSTSHSPNPPTTIITKRLITKLPHRKPATPPQPPSSTAKTTTNNAPVFARKASSPTPRLALRRLVRIRRVMLRVRAAV